MTTKIALGKYSPSKEQSFELIEECRQSIEGLALLLQSAIPMLIESGKQEELYTLLTMSFSELKADLDGIEMATTYLELHIQSARE